MTRVKADVSAPQIDGLLIDWDLFDDFAEGAGDMWRELVMFAIRMPVLIPQLDQAELPDVVKKGLNTLLLQRGTELLEARNGLVVTVADSVQEAVGELSGPLPVNVDMPSQVQAGTAAAEVLKWLRGEAPEEMATYGPMVEGGIQLQLGAYEDYEAGVLQRINRSLDSAMKALDLVPGPSITRAALSQICGRTIRDWAVQ